MATVAAAMGFAAGCAFSGVAFTRYGVAHHAGCRVLTFVAVLSFCDMRFSLGVFLCIRMFGILVMTRAVGGADYLAQIQAK